MTPREMFEKVRTDTRIRFSLRSRMTVFVTLELLICIPVSYGLDALLTKVLNIAIQIPLAVELLFVSLLVGILVTSLMSRFFFEPIRKLRGVMDQVAGGEQHIYDSID